jgi:hypothetical protein
VIYAVRSLKAATILLQSACLRRLYGIVLMSDVVQITHQKGHWTPGPLRTGERSKISLFYGEARRGLQVNHQRITNRAYVTKNRLVFRQTSKEIVEALIRERPRQGKDITGLP